MIERDGYPPGVPCWVDTRQPDIDAALAFYGGLFGWAFDERAPEGAPARYVAAQLQGRDVAGFGSPRDGAPPVATWDQYIWVESANDATLKVKTAGGRVLVEPVDRPGAGRMAVCADPSGAVFSIWEAEGHKGAQLVNEPGTWNFSELYTRDPEGAKAFYGEVFGWSPLSFDLGDGADTTMFGLAGYGDHLAQLDPDLDQRQEDDQAPAGFADVVAWLMPMSDDQYPADVPEHWGITFAVADCDASAAKAIELGATVITAPFEAPYVRMAVISDPQGAVLTVSQYKPPE